MENEQYFESVAHASRTPMSCLSMNLRLISIKCTPHWLNLSRGVFPPFFVCLFWLLQSHRRQMSNKLWKISPPQCRRLADSVTQFLSTLETLGKTRSTCPTSIWLFGRRDDDGSNVKFMEIIIFIDNDLRLFTDDLVAAAAKCFNFPCRKMHSNGSVGKIYHRKVALRSLSITLFNIYYFLSARVRVELFQWSRKNSSYPHAYRY